MTIQEKFLGKPPPTGRPFKDAVGGLNYALYSFSATDRFVSLTTSLHR